MTWGRAIVLSVLLAPIALGGSADDPEVRDATGDAQFLGRGYPALDIVSMWLTENVSRSSDTEFIQYTVWVRPDGLRDLAPPPGYDYLLWGLTAHYSGHRYLAFGFVSPNGGGNSGVCVEWATPQVQCRFKNVKPDVATELAGVVSFRITAADLGGAAGGARLTEVAGESWTGRGVLSSATLGNAKTVVDTTPTGRDFVTGKEEAVEPEPSPARETSEDTTTSASEPAPRPVVAPTGEDPWWASSMAEVAVGTAGLVVSGAVGGYAVYATRRRRRTVHDYVRRLDQAIATGKGDPARGLASLGRLRAEVRTAHAGGGIEDGQFLELDRRASAAIGRMRVLELNETARTLPAPLLGAFGRLVEDGSVTAAELRMVEREMLRQAVPASTKEAVTRAFAAWAAQDEALGK
ncbi:MAG: hypothetical protein ACT4PT_12240 [Methanobacteriota archaeon]